MVLKTQKKNKCNFQINLSYVERPDWLLPQSSVQNLPQKFLKFIKVCLNNIGIEIHVAIKQFKTIICTACRFCIDGFVGKIIRIKRSIEIAVNVRVEKHNEAPFK